MRDWDAKSDERLPSQKIHGSDATERALQMIRLFFIHLALRHWHKHLTQKLFSVSDPSEPWD